MTTTEKTELVLIFACVVVLFFSAGVLSPSISLARLVMYCSGLLLFQGLLRDLWYLYAKKLAANKESTAAVTEAKQCMCLESSIGMIGIVTGVVLLLGQFSVSVPMSSLRWTALVGAVLVIGFLMKDLVFYWRRFQIRREKNHSNIIFTLRGGK